MTGFQFHETMSGSFVRKNSGSDEQPFTFTVTARAAEWLRFIYDRRAIISGHVDAGDLAHHASLDGRMVIDPLLGRRIAYEFNFTSDDGKPFRFVGEKSISPFHPLASMTTLPGRITSAAGEPYASALLRFDLCTLPTFLASFRLC